MECKAGYTLSVMCDTLTEHTLMKLEIKGDTQKYLCNMVHSNSLSCYKSELITESNMPLIISIFSSECSVKVPHMTDSVDGA